MGDRSEIPGFSETSNRIFDLQQPPQVPRRPKPRDVEKSHNYEAYYSLPPPALPKYFFLQWLKFVKSFSVTLEKVENMAMFMSFLTPRFEETHRRCYIWDHVLLQLSTDFTKLSFVTVSWLIIVWRNNTKHPDLSQPKPLLFMEPQPSTTNSSGFPFASGPIPTGPFRLSSIPENEAAETFEEWQQIALRRQKGRRRTTKPRLSSDYDIE